jgi:hypothetical protein
MNRSHTNTALLASVALCLSVSATKAAEPVGFSLSERSEAAAANVILPTTTGQSRLRRLSVDSGETFFPGESSTHEFPFFALPNEVASPATLVLSMQTAISAAPERSTMRVFVNDTDVGTVELRSGDPRRIELPIANGIVQPGYNSVSMIVDQKHRVDCSLDATYELWTQIDPEKSGFVFSGAAAQSKGTIADLIAQGRGNDGRASLVAHILPGASTVDIDRTMSVIQTLSILGDFDNPAVTFDPSTSAAGIDVYVGTYGTVRGLLDTDASSTEIVDGLQIDAAKSGNRSRLIISARTADELELHIKKFEAQLQEREMTGTPQGLRALANRKGQLLQPASQVALRDLGFISKPFSGRLYSETINFSMPSDFYPADYASLGINLSAQYAAGLSKDAVLIVKANGQIVSNIQLGDGRTGVIKNQRLPIPLSKLRPGENTVTFEAQLPMVSDATCDPIASLQEPPRFLIMDETYLDIPAYARVGRYPDLAALVSGADFAGPDKSSQPLNVYVPKLDREILDVAGSFIAKMAYSSGHVTDVTVTATQPDRATAGLLAFGTFASIPQALQSEMKLDLNNIAVSSIRLTTPATTQAEYLANKATQGVGEATDLAGRAAGYVQSSRDLLWSGYEWTRNRLPMQMAGWSFSLAGPSELESKTYRPRAGTDLLVAQRATEAGGVWTVVASPNAEVMTDSMSALSQRATWRRLNGATQAFSQTGQLMDEQPALRETLFQTQPATFNNLRLVTAGWFANNTVEYTLAQIAAALLLGVSTFAMLKLGRKPR